MSAPESMSAPRRRPAREETWRRWHARALADCAERQVAVVCVGQAPDLEPRDGALSDALPPLFWVDPVVQADAARVFRAACATVPREARPSGAYEASGERETGGAGWGRVVGLCGAEGRPIWFEARVGDARARALVRAAVGLDASRAAAAALGDRLQPARTLGPPGASVGSVRAPLEAHASALWRASDRQRGGFADTDALQPARARLLLALGQALDRPELIDQAVASARRWVAGCGHDAVSGGFFSAAFSRPPRSLMRDLSHNAQMLGFLADVVALAPEAELRRAMVSLVEWWERELRRDEGDYAWGSRAASSSVSWTPAEIDAALGGSDRALRRHVGVHSKGPWDGRCPLQRREAIDRLARAWRVPEARAVERYGAALAALRSVRETRGERIDARTSAGANALAAEALLRASVVCGRPAWADVAARVLDASMRRFALARPDAPASHAAGEPEGSERCAPAWGDAAAFAWACGALHEQGGASSWRERGLRALAGVLAAGDSRVPMREASGEPVPLIAALDAELPSPCAFASAALRAWGVREARADWAHRADAIDQRFASIRERMTQQAATYVRVADVPDEEPA